MFKSDKAIRDIEVTGKRFEVSEDLGLPIGRLYLRVSPKGAKTFYFRYWSTEGNSSVYMKIGQFPHVTLSSARASARKLATDTSSGIDPVIEKRAIKANRSKLGTFDDLLKYYTDHLGRSGAKSAYNVTRSFDANVRRVFPELLRKPANEITSQHIVDIVAAYIGKGAKADANRLRSYLLTAFNVAASAENDPLNAAANPIYFQLTTNPVAVVKRQAQFEKVGERVIEPEELRDWLPHFESHSSITIFNMTKAMFWLGGQRISVLINLRFDMIDEDRALVDVPGHLTKNGTAQVIPVLPEAMDIFRFMGRLHGTDGLVFPSAARGKINVEQAMLSTSVASAFRRAFKVCPHWSNVHKNCSMGEELCPDREYKGRPFVPKDIRRTVKTWMGRAGIEKSIRDRLQHHALSDVSSKHYDRYDYLSEKREAMAIWGEWLRSEVLIGAC